MPRRKPEDPATVRVRVLGATEITVGHRRIGMNTEILFALALYLTTRAGERIPREELLELFYGAGNDEDHRHALRQQMYRLRQKGFELDDAGELIRLNPDRVDSDLRAALADGWWERSSAESIDVACEWGPTFSRQKSAGFLEWLDGIRVDLSSNVRRAALRQIGVARREGRWADLDRWAKVILKSDPLNEEATLARAESAAMAGSKTIALEIIDNYLSELGDMSAELGKPALQMRKRIAERRPDWAMRGPKEVALVGRTALMTKLTGLVEDVWRGSGRAMVLTGAAGIGKSRLAAEARAYAELKGMRTIHTTADPASSTRPLSSLQSIVGMLLELPGASGCFPSSLQMLRQALEQSQRLPRNDVAAIMVSISDRLPDAIVDLIDSVSHECKVLVLVDDLHNMDTRSHEALDAIILATSDRRIGWLFTTRDRARYAVAETPLFRGASRCRVSPLDEGAARELALLTSAAHGISPADGFVDSVAQTAGGNPLFIRELAVASRHRPHAAGLPESLTRVIEERLDRLSVEQRSALAAIALFGETATLELVERAVARPAIGIAADLNALEGDGVLSVSERRHLVLHECWRQAILDGLSATSRAALEKQCADVLCDVAEGHRTARHDWIAAKLYKDAGYLGQAMILFLRAADGLFASGLPVESVRVVRTAQELARSDTDAVELQARLVVGLLASGEHLAALIASESSTRQLPRLSGEGRIAAATLLCARVEALVRAGRPPDEEIRALVELATDTSIPLKLRQGCALMGLVWAVNAGDDKLRDEFHAASTSLARGETPSLAGHLARVVYACECESVPEIQSAILSLQTADTAGESMSLRCRAVRYEGRAFRQLGLHDDARKAFVRSYDLAIAAHLHFDASVSAEALTYIELDTDRLDNAEMWLGRFEALTPDSSAYERQSSMSHCRDRVLIQRGKAREALDRLRARADVIRADWNKRRKLTELSTYAFCLADAQVEHAALESLSEVKALLAELGKDFSSDYGAEMACRALRALNREEEARIVGDWYVRQSVSRVPHEFAPFYSALGAYARDSAHTFIGR